MRKRFDSYAGVVDISVSSKRNDGKKRRENWSRVVHSVGSCIKHVRSERHSFLPKYTKVVYILAKFDKRQKIYGNLRSSSVAENYTPCSRSSSKIK